ncbi:MAG: ATP-binding cassette domain-containing protein [Alphaproteobacteria bacterium]
MSLVIRDLVKTFGEIRALDEISFEASQGSFVCFLGPSGCGKTTLLRVIAGLERADGGAVHLDGRDLSLTAAAARNFGVVFQSYSLFPNMTALTNVGYGLRCRRWAKADILARSQEMLALVQLEDQKDKLPEQMSGGQQQRVALARALAPDPSLLLLDEPLSALDAKVREELRHEIRAIQQRLGVTTIMVTHDQEEALAMSDLVVVMNVGRIEQVGTPKTLYEHPETAFVADFIGGMNLLPIAFDTESTGGTEGTARFGSAPIIFSKTESGSKENASQIGVRPESLLLKEASHAENGEANHILCSVRSISYLGNVTRVFVVTESPSVEMTVELHGQSELPAMGDRISISFAPEAVRLLS